MSRLVPIALVALASVASADTVKIGPGIYRPIFPASPAEKEVAVDAFLLDKTPVTNAQFQTFVHAHPAWSKSAIKPLLADDQYLSHWESSDSLGTARPNA